MDLSPESQVIHERARLRIMGLLYRENDLAFAAIREDLGLTGGNLASHIARLEAEGLVEGRDALTRGGFERRVQITELGIARFDQYVQELEALLGAVKGAPSEPLPELDPGTALVPAKASRLGQAMLATGGVFVLGEGLQQWFGDASGSSYLGIAASGGLLALMPLILRLPKWWTLR